MQRFGQEPAKHLFDVMVKKDGNNQFRVEVLANTRSQAGNIMRKLGYEVWSVNMVG